MRRPTPAGIGIGIGIGVRALVIVAALVPFALASLAGDARAAATDDVAAALADWDVQRAAQIAEAALARDADDPEALLASAHVAFYRSDYPRTLELATRAAAKVRAGSETAKAAADIARSVEERKPTWSSFTEHRRGPFVVRVTPGDRILVPYALRAIEAAAAALEKDLGLRPDEPVVIEMYPNRRTFIAASTLTREEVETSGTLAICHFNRIMMLSPGVMANGYDWMDALCHEYVHFTVYHLGGKAVPVWLHEGIAKHLETRWRVDVPEPLEPRMASILAEGLEKGRWVTFAQMHPSMAKLPSAPLVALAFAEVAVTAEMMREQHGGGALGDLVRAVRVSDGDLDAALGTLWKTDLAGLEAQAKVHARSLGLARVPGLEMLDATKGGEAAKPEWFVFKDEGEAPEDPETLARKLEDRKAQDFTILGDRLKGRKFFDAAIVEYDKAIARLGHSDPIVADKKAHALLLANRPADALPVLEEALRWSPSYAVTLDNLAEVHLRLSAAAKDPAESERHARLALALVQRSERINPFATDTHLRLAALYERFGRKDDAELSRERLATLRE